MVTRPPSPPGRLGRRSTAVVQAASVVAWGVALIGYFSPWVFRRPLSAALAWNAYDLFDVLRLLPEIETGAVTVNLQTFRLPLLGLALLLSALLAWARWPARLAGVLIGIGMAAATLPPYPQILTAWRTPGWRVPFWWGLGAMAGILITALIGQRLGQYLGWWMLAVAELSVIPAAVTLYRLLPALSALHATPVRPGWGFWSCCIGLTVLGMLSGYDVVQEGAAHE